MKIPFTTEDYGKLIPQKLSDILSNYTDGPEQRRLAIEFNVSHSLIRDVSKRRMKLTAYNSKAIEALAEIALKNADKRAKKAALSRTYLKALKKAN